MLFRSRATSALTARAAVNQNTFQFLKPDGTALWRGSWDTGNFHQYLGAPIFYNLNGQTVTFGGGNTAASYVRLAASAVLRIDSPIVGATASVLVGSSAYATATDTLTSQNPLVIQTWAWNGTNGSTLTSTATLKATQRSTTAGDSKIAWLNSSLVEVMKLQLLDGRMFSSIPASAPTDADIAINRMSAWLDEAGAALKFRVRKSDGTYLTGTVALA